MKILSSIACVLHFSAVLMTSGVALCVGNDGHADYEWTEDECCGEPAEVVAKRCCEACEIEAEPEFAVRAAPDCGGCVDGLAPLMSGVAVELHPFVAEPAGLRVEETMSRIVAEADFAAGEPLMCGPPVPLPLRC